MSDNAKLTEGSIARHLFAQTAPIVAGVAAIMSIGIIDAYFIGKLGATELAAMSFIFPVTTALSSLGVGIMAGTSSVVSRALGAGEDEEALHSGNLGIFIGLGAGLLVAALLALFHGPLFRLMGADEEMLELVGIYVEPFALGFPMLLVVMGINGVLRAQGAAKRSTVILLSFAVANWILDPILIEGAFGIPGFGVAGAAYATAAGWALGLGIGFWMLQTSDLPFAPSRLGQADWTSGIANVLHVAVPAAFTNAINPVGLAVLTAFLAADGEAAVAGFGVGGRLQTFAVVPLLALSSSIGAIVGQNWGADRHDRARLAMWQAGGFCIAYGLLAALVLFVGRDWLSAQFSEDAATIGMAARYLEIAVWGYAAYGLFILSNGAFNAIDRAGLALALSLARVLALMVPFALLLQPGWGADAVFGAELVSNLLAGAAAIAVLWWIFVRAESGKAAGASAAA